MLLAVVLVVAAGGALAASSAGDSTLSDAHNNDEINDVHIDMIHVTEPAGDSYEVDNLEAPETVNVSDEIEVSADITNPNNFTTTQRAEYRFNGDVEQREYLTLEANETEMVSFTLNTTDLEPSEQIHGVYTFDNGSVATISIEEEPEPEPERTAELTVEDQEGDGETHQIANATSNVEFYLQAAWDDEMSESESFDADEMVENYTLDLDPAIENDTTVTVSVHAAEDDEELVAEDLEYTLEEPEPERTAELTVEDQEGDGETLQIANATSNVEFYLQAAYDTETSESESFDADEMIENYTLDLDPAIENDTTVTVSVHAAEDDEELVAENLEYTVEEPEPEPERTAELTVEDQEGDGETLEIVNATSNVEFYLQAAWDNETSQSPEFGADDMVENYTLILDPSLENDTTVTVSVHAVEDDEELVAEDIEYTLDEEPEPEPERTAELTVEDQEGEGETLQIANATSNVEFYLQAAWDDETSQSENFDADAMVENHTLALDPPIEEDTTVTVSVHAADDDEELVAQDIEYTVEEHFDSWVLSPVALL